MGEHRASFQRLCSARVLYGSCHLLLEGEQQQTVLADKSCLEQGLLLLLLLKVCSTSAPAELMRCSHHAATMISCCSETANRHVISSHCTPVLC
jgi:hypothetical protein